MFWLPLNTFWIFVRSVVFVNTRSPFLGRPITSFFHVKNGKWVFFYMGEFWTLFIEKIESLVINTRYCLLGFLFSYFFLNNGFKQVVCSRSAFPVKWSIVINTARFYCNLTNNSQLHRTQGLCSFRDFCRFMLMGLGTDRLNMIKCAKLCGSWRAERESG